ncbi:hypothetical protein L7F22_065962 [Adiantum nelumboides]|nr:hypothetical protein [Adiantum nelumboides]
MMMRPVQYMSLLCIIINTSVVLLLVAPLMLQPADCDCGRCLPSAECWPDEETWNALNVSVGGRLLRPRPSAAPCHHHHHHHTNDDDDERNSFVRAGPSCQETVQNWNNASWRSAQPGAMQFLNAESHGDLTCRLPSSPDFAYTACYQGAVPAYAVRVSETSDVQAAIRFATQHNLRLTIKSTGHDVMGRSTAPASLNLWLHHLKHFSFRDDFRPQGCSSADGEMVAAVTAEAGVQWSELYEAADSLSRVVVGGMSGSVSTAGGYMQGGGHSPLSPLLGLAADNILEMEVVTADGNLVTANACQNRDLFWALRGGGGGTYGVVMSATHRAHPALERPWGAQFSAKAHSISSFQSLVAKFVELQASLSDSGAWAGYSYLNFTTITAVYLLPNGSSIEALSAFEAITTFAEMHAEEMSVDLSIEAFPSFQAWRNSVYTMCNEAYKSGGGCSDTTGSYGAIASRLLPKALLQNNGTELAGAFLEILGAGVERIMGMLVGGRAVGTSAERDDNAVNPAWRTALWHVVVVSTWTAEEACAATEASKSWLVTSANALLRELTPHSGCYMNEADSNEPDWQSSFYGSNFERLTSIKTQVDPQGVFSCWKCIGSEIGVGSNIPQVYLNLVGAPVCKK